VRGPSVTLILTTLLASPVSAEQQQTRFTVAVNVPVRITLDVIDQPAELTLTAQDIARGYKEVSARYRVRHNDRNGYLLRIAPRAGITKWVEVRGLGVDVVLHGDFVDIHQPGQSFLQDLSFEFRFVLDTSTPPGTFELPLQISATPI
jgi:hypothetical protein